MANKVLLMGRLTKNPEIKWTTGDNPTAIARYTLAADRKFKKDGEAGADFIPCVVFGKGAEFADKYLRQGTKILVIGRLQSGSYTNKDGIKVYTMDVVVEEQEFAESKRTSDQSEQVSTSAPATQTAQTAKPAAKTEEWMSIPDGVEENLPWE